MKNIVLQGFAIIAITGCTSIQINNTSEFHPESIRQVCIVNNPKVIIKDFNGIVERSFSRYGIEAKTYQENDNLSLCQTTLHYTALRSWDFAPYMVSAQFNLLQNGRQVSEASFRLKGNGGFALNRTGFVGDFFI